VEGGIPLREFEKFFKEEVKEKKIQTYGNRARTGKGARKGARRPMFNSDRMSRKEFREYTKAGEVKVTNMYEAILHKDEFDTKPQELQKTMMTLWREKYPNTQIMKEMGLTNTNQLSRILKGLDIPLKRRGGYKGRTSNAVAKSVAPVTLPVEVPKKAEQTRSEERRVGKKGRNRRGPSLAKKKEKR